MAIFAGKSRLIRLGNNTFPMAMPTPIMAVPISNMKDESTIRAEIPSMINIKAINKACSKPCFLARVAANGEIMAKAINGSVVRNPACDAVRLKLAIICSSTGAIPVKGARKLAAMSNIPITSKMPEIRDCSLLRSLGNVIRGFDFMPTRRLASIKA